jgi:hypothetical protein
MGGVAMTPDEIIEKYAFSYWQGVYFVTEMIAAITALEAGDPASAEANHACNGWTIGCPS